MSEWGVDRQATHLDFVGANELPVHVMESLHHTLDVIILHKGVARHIALLLDVNVLQHINECVT